MEAEIVESEYAVDESFFDGIEAGLIIEDTANSGLSQDEILGAIKKEYNEIARIGSFVSKQWGGQRRANSNLFNQDVYTIPSSIFDQMRIADFAVKYDDVVSGAADITEQLAFKEIDLDSGDVETSDIGTQILNDLKIITRMREIWRDMFTYSQCYVAVQWSTKTYKVRERKDGSSRPRKKEFKNLRVPIAMSVLDPLKVVPVGDMMFGNERLAYIADPDEYSGIMEGLGEMPSKDLVVHKLFESKYTPTNAERQTLAEMLPREGGILDRLILLREDAVFRVALTKPAYQRFADVRLASTFELLDLKHNLRESDRSDVLGNLNCIVHVKVGSKDIPASSREVADARNQFKTYSRNNLMITDNRVEVEILTKKTDKTLQPERHNMLDARLTARVYQILSTGNYAAGTAVDDSTKLFKIIAASMEARRDTIREQVMDHIIDRIWEENNLKGDPILRFHPQKIALDFDRYYSTLLQQLNTLEVISNETMLDELGLDINQEASRLRHEKDEFGDLFNQRDTPGGKMTSGVAGGIYGGNSNGGGTNLKSFQATPRNEPSDPVESVRKQSDPTK